VGYGRWRGQLNGKDYILLRFDSIFGNNPGQIPPGSIVTAATLTYNVNNAGNDANINEVTIDWADTVTYNTFGGDTGVQTDEYGASLGIATGDAGDNSLDVTSSVVAWSQSPGSNHGWIFRPVGTDGVNVWSSEYAAVTVRPRLSVDYRVVTGVDIFPDAISAVAGATNVPITLAIPYGSNAGNPVQVTLTSNNPAIAVPYGAVGGALTVRARFSQRLELLGQRSGAILDLSSPIVHTRNFQLHGGPPQEIP